MSERETWREDGGNTECARSGRENAEVENETGEHTAASSSSVRPGSPSALQLNSTPLRPSGALRLHSFSSGISLNGSRNLERIPDPTTLIHPPPRSSCSSLVPLVSLLFICLSVCLSSSAVWPFRLELKRRDSCLSFLVPLSLNFPHFSRPSFSLLISSFSRFCKNGKVSTFKECI